MGLLSDLKHGEWYSEFAICPMCGAFTYPRYHRPRSKALKDRDNMSFSGYWCNTPVAETHHNHMHCRCGFEWTLPPRNKKEFERLNSELSS